MNEPRPARVRPGFLLAVLAGTGVAVWLAWPSKLIVHRPEQDGEVFVPNELITIAGAESMFRERGLAPRNELEYGSLAQLASATLVDPALGTGTKHGYTFRVEPGDPRAFIWWALARPIAADADHSSVYFANETGKIWKLPASDSRLPDPKTGDPPPGALPVRYP